MRQHGRDAEESDLHLPSDEVSRRGRGALIGNMREGYARHSREHRPRQMRGAAVAAGTVVDPPGLRARKLDQLLHRTCRKRRMRDERVGSPRHQRHRSKVPPRVVRDLADQGIDDEASRPDRKQRIAIGRRLSDEVGADVAAGARTVLDDERLPPGLRELLGDQTHDDVVRPAGGERHDDPHGPGGVVLRMRTQTEQHRAKRRAEADADSGAKFCHSLHRSQDPCDVKLPGRALCTQATPARASFLPSS